MREGKINNKAYKIGFAQVSARIPQQRKNFDMAFLSCYPCWSVAILSCSNSVADI